MSDKLTRIALVNPDRFVPSLNAQLGSVWG